MTKRISFALLALALAFALSCNGNRNGNANSNANSNANANNSNRNEDASRNSNQNSISPDYTRQVQITISDGPGAGRCSVSIVDPNPVHVKKDRDDIKWCIVNACKAVSEITVTIDNFRGATDPSLKDPFGGTPGDNTFKVGPIASGSAPNCGTVSGAAVGAAAAYRYRIQVTGPDGKVIASKGAAAETKGPKGEQEPVVVIDP